MISYLPHFSCGVKKAVALLEKWIKDYVIHLLEVEFLPVTGDLKDPKYYHFHKRKGHLPEQCFTFRKTDKTKT